MFRGLIALVIALATLSLHAQDNRLPRRETVVVDIGADHFIAGGNITVNKPIAGDLLAAGSEVVLADMVGGDAVLAGGSLRLDGNVAQDVYAAGGRVLVNGHLARNARLAGGMWRSPPDRKSRAASASPRARPGSAVPFEAIFRWLPELFTSTVLFPATWMLPRARSSWGRMPALAKASLSQS